MRNIYPYFRLLALCLGLAISQPAICAVVGPNYVFGTVTALTNIQSGVMIQIEGGQVSQNCINSAGWMIIDAANQHTISAVLSSWFTGRRYLYIYTSATSNTYCAINQVQLGG
jgi:hypothetical protein